MGEFAVSFGDALDLGLIFGPSFHEVSETIVMDNAIRLSQRVESSSAFLRIVSCLSNKLVDGFLNRVCFLTENLLTFLLFLEEEEESIVVVCLLPNTKREDKFE